MRQGFVLPYLEGSQGQNEVVIDALSGATVGDALGRYPVVVDAIIGPWLLDPFLASHHEAGVSVHYVVLRPSEEVALARAVARTAADDLRDEEPIRKMYGAFSSLGDRESNVVDSSALTPEATVDVIRRGLADGLSARLSGELAQGEGRGVNEGEACTGCGFVYNEAGAPDAAQRVRMLSKTIADRLMERPVNEVDRHVPPLTWSALEYACHLRDDLLVQRERVLLARRVDHPTLTPMGRDERANHDGYESRNVADVARQLVEGGRLFAHVLDLLDDDSWTRTVVYNWPEPADRNLRWVAVHTVHELVHHLGDIEHVLMGP